MNDIRNKLYLKGMNDVKDLNVFGAIEDHTGDLHLHLAQPFPYLIRTLAFVEV